MRVLITGAAGMIGRCLTEYLHGEGHQVIPVDIVKHQGIISIDLRDEMNVFRLFEMHNPNLILHLAALTNLDFCEQNQEASRATNYGITEVLVKSCLKYKTRLVFLSSDYVFGQHDCLWKERDSPCPTTQYGKDKAAAEYLIRSSLSDYAIIRTAQLYGFHGDFVSLVYDALTTDQMFSAFANLVNCPTWIGDLFAMISIIILNQFRGVFHCVGTDGVSRYQYAGEVAKAFKLDKSLIKSINLDFSVDIRPPIVRLSGLYTYDCLGFYPGRLQDNLSNLSRVLL